MDVTNRAQFPSQLANGAHSMAAACPPQDPGRAFDSSHYLPAQRPRLALSPDNPVQAYRHLFLDDGNLKASGQSVWEHDGSFSANNSLILETGNEADQLQITQTPEGQMNVQVNGQLYRFAHRDKDGELLTVHLKTWGGNDRVIIDASVTQPITVDAGDDNDRVFAGSGYTRLFGGSGDDFLRLGSGMGYAEGNDGDDTILGGIGDMIMYGNNGNDRLYAGAGSVRKTSYLDGGAGNDRLYSGSGHTVLHGGADDDRLIGYNRSTFYTGDGHDTVIANRPGDLIYSKPGDAIRRLNGSVLTHVSPGNQPLPGIVIKGSAEFIQRVEDDLALLRSSPNGQQLLAELDAIALRNGAPLAVVEDPFGIGSRYTYGSQELKALLHDERPPVVGDDPKWGFMVAGVPGSKADRAEVVYDRSSLIPQDGVTNPPITGLYHEMIHAYNAGNGTSLAGSTEETLDGESHDVPNSERQAVGLPSSAKPFDFDNDSATPPTTTNPKPFTENALKEEMGTPLRRQYVG